MMNTEIKRLALLDRKPKDFAWLLQRVEAVLGHSRAVDMVIKDGIRNLIAENPNNAYLKNYLGTLL